MSRPSDKPDWINDNVTGIEVPTPAEQDAGWDVTFTTGLKPPRQWFNWFQNRVVQWINRLAGQSGEYIVIDSTAGREKERDYETLADYIADSPFADDKVLVKTNQVLTAQMVIPDGITLKILDGVNFTRSTLDAVSVIEFGSNWIIEGVLNIILSQTGTTAKAIEINGDNGFGNIVVENSSTGTITDVFAINSGKEGNKINALVSNTGAGTFSNIILDNSGKASNDIMIRDIENDEIIALHSHESSENLLINGCLSIFQEGTTIDSTTTPANNDDTYVADGFILLSDGNDIVDVSRDKTGLPVGARSSIKLDVETASKKFGLFQVVEGLDSRKIIGNKASLSFKAKASVGATVNNLRAAILSWDGTEDAVISDVVSVWNGAGTDPTLVANWTYENVPSDLALTDSYQTFKIEGIDIDTASTTNMAIFIWVDDVDATVADFLNITDIKLEKGRKATLVDHKDIEATISQCERQFEKSYDLDVAPGTASNFNGMINERSTRNEASFTIGTRFNTRKRSTPVVIMYSPSSGASGKVFEDTTGDIDGTAVGSGETGIRTISVPAGNTGFGHNYHYTSDSRL